MKNLESEYLQTVIRRLRYYKDLGEKTFDQLSEAEFHYKPNDASNSIAVIIQHLSGNMLSRFTNFLTEDGEKPWRERDAEFTDQHLNREELLALWQKGWDCFLQTLENLQPGDLLKTITIRNEQLSAIDAINRQFAHYPSHIGQIIYLGRVIRGEQWKNLSIPVGNSKQYNEQEGVKDPAKKF